MNDQLYSGRYFPDEIFSNTYENYTVISFEDVFLLGFLEEYCNLLNANNVKQLHVETLSPEVKAINFESRINSEYLYSKLLKEHQNLEYIDVPMSFYQLVDKGALYSNVNVCPIYLDREFEIAVLGSNQSLDSFKRFAIKYDTLLQYIENEVFQRKCDSTISRRIRIWDERLH